MTFFMQKHEKYLMNFFYNFNGLRKLIKILIKLHLTNKTLSLNIFYIIWNILKVQIQYVIYLTCERLFFVKSDPSEKV